MALINITEIQNLDPATPESLNSRFGTIANEINGGLDSANLADGAVTSGKLATNAVTSGKITDGAIIPAKWSNPYKFRAFVSATAALPNSVWTSVITAEIFDTNNNFAAGIYTAPVAGFYQFNFNATTTNAAGGLSGGGVRLYKNGTTDVTGSQIEYDNNWSGDYGRYFLSDYIQLAAGDTIVPQAWLFLTTTTGIGQAYFSGFLDTET